jgi:succinate dehydrogenase / fumarate reductase, cytochrome b subunit
MSTLTSESVAVEKKARPLAEYHFLFRRLHSLTGIMFGSYLFVHLTINATLVEGARHGSDMSQSVFQGMVNYIHSIPFLIGVELAFIIAPIAYHTLYGFYIIYSGQPNVGRYGYTRNWLYIFQRVTAVILTFFILFHVLTFKGVFGSMLPAALTFEPLAATKSTIAHLNHAWWIWAIVYPIGVLAAAFHTANGFYAAAITWGLTISAKAQKRWGGLCVLICLFLAGAGMAALIAGVSKASVLKSDAPAVVAPNR